MAFKIALTPTFLSTVILTAYDEQGKLVKHKLPLRFKRKRREEVQQMLEEQAAEAEASKDAGSARTTPAERLEEDLDELLKIIDGWNDVEIDGSTEFNRDNLRAVLSYFPMAHFAIFEHYLKVNGGAALGN